MPELIDCGFVTHAEYERLRKLVEKYDIGDVSSSKSILNIQQGKNFDWQQPALNVWSITYDYRNDQQDYHIIAIFYFKQEADGNLWKVEGEGLPTLVPELWKALQGAFQEA
ncbi:MAG: hypothetical protein ACXAB4_09540 [Candidatus Hodarchaeales archaeon]|jgi:hypothetical protein